MPSIPEAPSTAPQPPARVRVAVVFGGQSSEHSVSCLTAGGVLAALDPERYEVTGIGITRSGRLVVAGPEVLERLHVTDGRLPELTEDAAEAVLVRGETGSELARREQGSLAALGRIDVAFSLLHGPFGEDGTIQGMFELMGVRYVGAGVLASAVGMDKHAMKLVLAASGLPIGPYAVITPRQWEHDRGAALESVATLTYPLFVKPARGGSSLGIRRVDDPADLEAAVEFARGYDPKVVVEQGFVNARELECGVLQSLDDGSPEVSAVAEIRMHTASGFYDFEAKYLPEEQVDLDVPAELDPAVAAEMQQLAARTFEAIGCEGLARVDFFLTEDRRLVVNEINTMPGFTEHSMFPRVWAASGLDYPSLVDRLLQLALQRPTGLR
ncbi:D-alanine-D-alanine ligase [Friedmanniella endophytica]|uniref:D-alanine--D-alanine ligase n=1 Tax=Microlunatus kandeliicorticis TaxID=1759536 RepID=A0A7W3IUN6_9ACTN|nr:D-alanine--D-alanine ligase family protein [Microlunatus kandeliicorticis]MBA8795445.1 D-alanine-D-alanine ligase [Microlunatus kandeliicorticis]